jgi:hypothetical protein
MRSWLVLGIIVASCAPIALAQQGSEASTPTPAPVKPKGENLEMRRIVNALSGRWSFTETSVPRPGASNTSRSRGEEVWHTATGGLTLVEDNHTKSATGDSYDTAVIWWDGKAQKIRGIWCSDINDEGCNGFDVRWDGDDVVMAGEWELGGQRRAWKEVFAQTGPNSFTQTLYFGPPGGAMERAAEIRAKRVPVHARAQ